MFHFSGRNKIFRNTTTAGWCWCRKLRAGKGWLPDVLDKDVIKTQACLAAEGQPQRTEHWVSGKKRQGHQQRGQDEMRIQVIQNSQVRKHCARWDGAKECKAKGENQACNQIFLPTGCWLHGVIPSCCQDFTQDAPLLGLSFLTPPSFQVWCVL